MRFAVEMRHLRRVVARADGEVGDTAASIRARSAASSVSAERAERFLELVAAAGAHDRHDVGATGAHPGERELRRVAPFSFPIWRSASTSFRFCSMLPC